MYDFFWSLYVTLNKKSNNKKYVLLNIFIFFRDKHSSFRMAQNNETELYFNVQGDHYKMETSIFNVMISGTIKHVRLYILFL